MKLFLHGVPDTPALWGPVRHALGLPDGAVRAPAMPGFSVPVPAGFACTKEAYVDWYVGEMEAAHALHGPLDLVGHDWGALLTLRAASLRPDLVRSWTIANAAPHPEYRWHQLARRWQTPVIGELVNLMITPKAIQASLRQQGLPADLAAEESRHVNSEMKGAILRLYRSAKTAGQDWWPGLEALPLRGLVFWGVEDPYVPFWVAEKFAEKTGATLVPQQGAGHWAVVERAEGFAEALRAHWA